MIGYASSESLQCVRPFVAQGQALPLEADLLGVRDSKALDHSVIDAGEIEHADRLLV
jgi:hypothetical protein